MSHLYIATKFDNGNAVLVPEINHDRNMMATTNKNNCLALTDYYSLDQQWKR